jgi:two-component system response regulator YesN
MGEMDDLCRAIIVDDEAWIREGLAEYIDWDRIGIQLKGAFSDGNSAFSCIVSEQIDIILTDIRMPEMTGLELIARIRELSYDNPEYMRLHHAKIIFLSGFDDFKYAQEALRLGAFDYLLKPTDVEDIEKVLLKAREKWESETKERDAKIGKPPQEPLSGGEAGDEPNSYLVKKALAFVRSHYQEDIQLSQIAEEAFISPNYLSRIIRQETGHSFSDHLSQARLEKAVELLTSTTFKVYQIGEDVGYANPRYFNDWFRKMTGMAPMEYRNRYTKG